MGIPTVNWYCNASYQFDLVSEIAPAYDFCLVPEKFRLDDYRRVGANPIYCQEAANPTVYRPHDVPAEFDVTFVGQRYGNRPMYLRRLVEAGVDVRAWGPRWDEQAWAARCKADEELAAVPARPLSDDELVAMYSRSRISLGFSAVAHVPERRLAADQAGPAARLRGADERGVLPGRAVRRAGRVLRAGKGSGLLRGRGRPGGEGRVLPHATRPSAAASATPACAGRGRSTRGRGGSKPRSGRWGSALTPSPRVLRERAGVRGLCASNGRKTALHPHPLPRVQGRGHGEPEARDVRHSGHPPRQRTPAAPSAIERMTAALRTAAPTRRNACASPAATSATRASASSTPPTAASR